MNAGQPGPVALRVADLAAGPLEVGEPDREHVVVVLGGTCRADCGTGGPAWDDLGARADVFDGPATAVYVPAGRTAVLAGAARVAVASAPGTPGPDRAPYVVRPGDVAIEHRGRSSWAREVHDIVAADRPADQLLVGETFHAPDAAWSGYPPHRHDRDDPPHEARLVEAFLVRVDPPTGFGVLVHYPDAPGDRAARVVTDGELVAVEGGYHSFAGAGGHRFYYLWAIAGIGRDLRFRTDPRDAWLVEPPA